MQNRQQTKRPHLSDTSSSSIDSASSPVSKPVPKKSKTMSEEQIATLMRKIDGLQSSVNTTNDLIKKMQTSLNSTIATTDMLNIKTKELSFINDIQSHRISILESRAEKSDARWYSNNLILCGVPEQGQREDCDSIARELFDTIGVANDNRSLQCAYRIGRFVQGKNRPMVVRFQHVKDRDLVWHKRKDLSEGHYIRSMYPPAIHRKRRVLQAISNYAEKIPRYKGTTRVTFSNKIMVGKVLCGLDDLDKLPMDLQKAVATKSQGYITLFFGGDTPLSNFYPSSFVVDNVHYSCNEQFYYDAKAKYYKDYESEVEILATHDPVAIKRIGKAIGDSGNDQKWHDTAEGFEAMHAGLRCKFEQNPYLRRVLLSTGNSILGEANPYDSTWGIGMSATNPKAFEQDQWTGKKHLGDLLMAVRQDLSG
jgi:ribA/ribD-fused uncharacterized protein